MTELSPNPAASAPQHYAQAAHQFQSGELDAARQSIERYLQARPDCRDGLNLQGIVLSSLRLWPQAESVFRRLRQLHPDFADASSNLGHLLKLQGRHAEAEGHLRRVTEQQPRHAGAWLNLGVTLQALGRLDEARACNTRVLELEPDNAQAWFNLGKLHELDFDIAQARAAYLQALRLRPGWLQAHSNLVCTAAYLPELSEAERFEEARRLGQTLASQHATRSWPLTPRVPLHGRPLRVGLVSGDLRAHPVGVFLESVLAASDPARLAFYAYHNHATHDQISQRLQAHCAQWRRVDTLSDEALARQIDSDGIDVLVDLAGHTALNRLGVFALRPAPLQVSWLGYFASTGLPAIDAVIADPHCVPEAEARWFTENVWRMPVSRFCFTPPEENVPVAPLPSLDGRPFTFGSCQHLAKVNDAVLGTWAAILQALPQARLRLQSSPLGDPRQADRLRTRLQRCGLDLARVTLQGAVPRADYLASHAEVDLLLDTFPYTGGTTTTEGLWMGVPTLTLAQPGMLGRQGEGLLKAVGLDAFVCHDRAHYIQEAVAWASSARRPQLASLRQDLRARLQRSALMDAPRFARDLAALLHALHAAQGHAQPPVTPEGA